MNPAQPVPPKKSALRRWLRVLAWVVGVLLVLQLALFFGVRGYASSHGGAEGVQTEAKLKILEGLLAAHKLLLRSYPKQEEGLESLFVRKGVTDNPERDAERLKDGWHRKFQYRIPGVHHPDSYDLFSVGPDGIEGTEDDIGNW